MLPISIARAVVGEPLDQGRTMTVISILVILGMILSICRATADSNVCANV
jgi:hypothetical protein